MNNDFHLIPEDLLRLLWKTYIYYGKEFPFISPSENVFYKDYCVSCWPRTIDFGRPDYIFYSRLPTPFIMDDDTNIFRDEFIEFMEGKFA